jgi:DNA-binding PadR family transcriptional regulator
MKKSQDKGFTSRVELARFEVLKLIQEGLSVTEISKYRHVSRTAIYGVIGTLVSKGWVRKPGRSMYELTTRGIEGLHSFVGFRYKLRQHNLHFKIEILGAPRNWALKRNELRQMPYFNKTIKLKNNEQDLFNYGKLQLKTTTKSIIIKMPTIYSANWEDAVIQAIGILEDSIPKLENLFKVRLVKDYKSNITIISQEYAKIQDALAKLYRAEGNRLYLTGEDGKIWMITDFSFSTDETEFIHSTKATDDVDAIAPFLNDIRKNPTTMSETQDMIKKVAAVQQSEAQNVVKHQKVLDKIMTNQDVLQDFLMDLDKRLKRAGI